MTDVPTAIFMPGAEAFLPTAHAVGPWDPEQLHGGAPCALLADALQELAPTQQMARLTVDFLGPVGTGPATVSGALGFHRTGMEARFAGGTRFGGGRSVGRAGCPVLAPKPREDASSATIGGGSRGRSVDPATGRRPPPSTGTRSRRAASY